MKQLIFGILALAVIGCGVAFALAGGDDETTSHSNGASHNMSQGASDDTAGSDVEAYLSKGVQTETTEVLDSTNVDVSIEDFSYTASDLTIKAGTTVTWTNNGEIQHTVTSADVSPDGGLDSGLFASGESFEFTFDVPGEYVYFCEPHPFQMRGIVQVIE